ncbi:MAG: V-type ATP synthase subunit E family protein [Deltaproteobacteria bacterium]|nr:V-type ATP synthase subunit E family protein [Deltaproteobacteria bacterium]
MIEKELLKTLEEDTRRECASIIEDAQKEADDIIKKAAEKLEKMKRERLEQAKASLQKERIKRLADARLHANEIILRQRQLAVTKVFEGVAGRLSELRKGKDYPDILKRLCKEAMDGWDDSMKDEKAFEILSDAGDMLPGVVIMSRDKRFKIINTLNSRLEKARPELVSMIDKILF